MFLCTMRNSGVVLCGGGDFFYFGFYLGWGFFGCGGVCVFVCFVLFVCLGFF